MVDLIEVISTGVKEVIRWIIDAFTMGLTGGYEALRVSLFGTPTPQTNGTFVLGTPTNEPWVTFRDALVGGEITLIACVILLVSVQGRHAVHLLGYGGTTSARRTRRSAWTGAALIVLWYWIAAVSLFLIDAFTLALVPGLDTVVDSTLALLEASLTNPMLALVLSGLGATAMWVLQALFLTRRLLLLISVYVMPIVIAVGFSGFPVLSQIARGFATRFVPLAILPLPAALVLKGYELLYTTEVLTPQSAFDQYLVGVSLPVVIVLVTWRVFKYATPRTARLFGGVVRGGAVLGTAAAGAAIAGPAVGATAAKWGPEAAAGHAAVSRLSGRRGAKSRRNRPAYRRTENDPLGGDQ